MSTIGFGSGVELGTGEEVRFCGDQRCLREVGAALQTGSGPIYAQVSEWQILRIGKFAIQPTDT